MSRLILLASVVAALYCSATHPEQPVASGYADALELLFDQGAQPTRLALRVEIDGQPLSALWDETFSRLHAYYDRNADGVLDQAEAARLPSPLLLRQVLWGQFIAEPGGVSLADVDRSGDGQVQRDELGDFYRRAGLGGVTVGVGKPPATDELTQGVLRHIDTDKDGQASEAEWLAAAETFRKLDKNDDNLIGPGELVPQTAYPGARGGVLMTAASPDATPHQVIAGLPFQLLPAQTADQHWATAAAKRRLAAQAAPIAVEGLESLRSAEPRAAWHATFDAEGESTPTLQAADKQALVNGRLVYALDCGRLELRADAGKLADQTRAACERFAAEFVLHDTNGDKALDGPEMAAPKAGQFKQLAVIADRDADGALSEGELKTWLDLQQQIARGHVLLTILDHGAGLFELLDGDHDGALSLRELRTAAVRLRAAGCLDENGVAPDKLPRCLLAAISRGQPQTSIGRPARSGPEWLLGMDRNGDGDVSIAEWVGELDVFHKLDADQDGLLSPAEAEQIAPPR